MANVTMNSHCASSGNGQFLIAAISRFYRYITQLLPRRSTYIYIRVNCAASFRAARYTKEYESAFSGTVIGLPCTREKKNVYGRSYKIYLGEIAKEILRQHLFVCTSPTMRIRSALSLPPGIPKLTDKNLSRKSLFAIFSFNIMPGEIISIYIQY